MDIQGILNAIWEMMRRIQSMPQLHAVLVGLFAGIAITYALAKFLPNNMDTNQAKRITALVAFGTTLILSLLISTTPQTFAWAFVFGLVAPALHGALVKFLIHKWPWAAPEAVMEPIEVAQADRRKQQIITNLEVPK